VVLTPPGDSELLDVRAAAKLAGRHPETVRRWVWSGRLAARREGSRLLVARDDVAALAAERGHIAPPSLAAWAERAQAALGGEGAREGRRSAADLVIEDRRERAAAGR
jgi:excisionase family DNA binding protein